MKCKKKITPLDPLILRDVSLNFHVLAREEVLQDADPSDFSL